MTDPTPDPDPQPQPVTGAAHLAGLVSGAFTAIAGLVFWFKDGGFTAKSIEQTGTMLALSLTAVLAVASYVITLLHGRNAADLVTPLSSPRDDDGNRLVPETTGDTSPSMAPDLPPTPPSGPDTDTFRAVLDRDFEEWKARTFHHDDTQELAAVTSGIHAHPTRKLGKRPTDPNRPVLRMGAHFTAAAFTAPASIDYASKVPGWILGGNDRFGTCGPTSVANLALLVSTLLADAPVEFTDDEIFDLYRRSGNPTFDPATGAGDKGVDMTVMLSELVKNGIGSGERNVKAVAFGSIDPHDTAKLWAAGALFGGVLWGADLEVAQQQQTDAGLWDYKRSGDWGGHAILSAPAYSDGPGTLADRTKLVTWAELIAATDTFIGHQVSECYVVLLPWHLGDKRIYEALDMQGVADEYEQLTGRPFPAPVEPPAPEPPAPAPGPAPVVLPPVSVKEWAQRTLALKKEPHYAHDGATAYLEWLAQQ